MEFEQQFIMQRKLDAVITKEKGLSEKGNMDWKTTALLTEIAECANEWRGFKKWSKNQNPSKIIHTTAGATEENAVEFACNDEDCGERFDKTDARLQDLFGKNNEDCPVCGSGFLYAFRVKNPLLEEFIDIFHFILSVGLELHLSEAVDTYTENLTNEDVTVQFNKLFLSASLLNLFALQGNSIEVVVNEYNELFSNWLHLGKLLGFTREDVELAYLEKNEANHERQHNGY